MNNSNSTRLNKLQAPFKENGWFSLLKTFLVSEDFEKIFSRLEKNVKEGDRFTPTLKQVFNAFSKCPYEKLKVVIVGWSPYPEIGIADGMAFSCSNTMKPEQELRYILHHAGKDDDSPDLTRWAEQGVLLLNAALTTELNKPGKHIDIWKDFTTFVIDSIQCAKPDVLFVLVGEKSWGLGELVNGHCLHVSYPQYGEFTWNNGYDFKEINKILVKNNISPIAW